MQDLTLLALLLTLAEIAGIVLAVHAVLRARSSQAAIAWSIALVTIPIVTIWLYLVFGRSRFLGYVEALRMAEGEVGELVRDWLEAMAAHAAVLPPQTAAVGEIQRRMTDVPFTGGNRVRLLIDGEATYAAMLEAIAEAQSYVLVQYYIVRDDGTGRRLRDALVEKAQAGVQVRFLYDEIGSAKLPQSYLDVMRRNGVVVTGFKTTRGRGNRFQINFRNHRKFLVVDGRIGFMGGLNLGDEYLQYRDTHLRIEGPAAQHMQLTFAKDWYWATRQIPGVDADLQPRVAGDQAVAIADTGPADRGSHCSVLFLTMISSARRRLWIASPYFVPDDICVRALQAAALRGVDVRVLLPDKADQRLVELASFTYYTEMLDSGVKLFRFRDRFMHQKIIMVDDTLAGVGTVNFDNRSLYLNFEATALVADVPFVAEVHAMLERDLAQAKTVAPGDFSGRPLWFRFLARLARLTAPLL